MKKLLVAILGTVLFSGSSLYAQSACSETPAGVAEGQEITAGGVGESFYTNGAAHISARLCGGVAGNTIDGYLFGPGPETYLGTVNGTNSGTVDVGAYTEGSEIIFKIYVRNSGKTYFSGSRTWETDGVAHAAVLPLGGNRYWVGLNDNEGRGDYDFNDIQFVVQIDTVNEICPCDNNWANHGAYVSCVTKAVNSFVGLGVLRPNEKGAIISEAGRSQCGK